MLTLMLTDATDANSAADVPNEDDDDIDDDDDDDDDVDIATRSSLAMNKVKSWSHAPCL